MPKLRRDATDIRAEILDFAQQGVTRSAIFSGLCLTYKQIPKYLSFLNDAGLVEIREAGGREIYITTEEGKKWLKTYRQLKEIEKQAA